jgi:hypothetical protein
LIEEIEFIINELRPAFKTQQSWEKAREIIFGSINCHGRRTITGMLSGCGKQFNDWSSFYNLFSKMKIDTDKVLQIIQKFIVEEVDNQKYIYAHMDDTTIKKTGKRIPGTSWMRDPLGPKFRTNFIWGQKFIQISLALSETGESCQSRAIPVDFHHSPSAIKPKKGASKEEIEQYKEDKKNAKLSVQGSKRITYLRANLDKNGAYDKNLIISVDGSYTNKEVIKNLPERTILIGRIRKDTKLHLIPDSKSPLGRKRSYGDRIPTPEEIRQSDEYPWTRVNAWAAGKIHNFFIKVVKDVRWRSAGEEQNLTLVVIRPLGYRLTKNGVILYKQPAYLICTDTNLDIETLLQAYLWRWEIEVNFREEKTLLGCGQAQVRNPNSVTSVPSFIVAIYALLHLAQHKTKKQKDNQIVPRPKWYKNKEKTRVTTGDLLNNVRAQMYAKSININFSDFVNENNDIRSLRNDLNPYLSAPFFVRN